jgi:hypothetical protein
LDLQLLKHGVEKNLKIPNVHPETVNRRTDNAMTKRKRTNNDLQTLHKKLNIEKGYRNKTGDELRYPERVRLGLDYGQGFY